MSRDFLLLPSEPMSGPSESRQRVNLRIVTHTPMIKQINAGGRPKNYQITFSMDGKAWGEQKHGGVKVYMKFRLEPIGSLAVRESFTHI